MKLVAIVGPTGVGKSSLALSLAREFAGEIINADSRQVYRYLDIGTAKPTRKDREVVPHHLLDLVDPDEDFAVALYQKLACEAISGVTAHGRLPFLVGGSGLYVWSVLEGWQTPDVPPDPALRASLSRKAEVEGPDALFQMLEEADPDSARRIDPRNTRRVIRALEVCRSGVRFSQLRTKMPPGHDLLVIGLTANRETLYAMIDSRVDRMMEKGLLGELMHLKDKGYGPDLPSMSGIGYRQLWLYIGGKLTMDAAVQEMKFESHRFARHQYAWFRPGDARVHWLEAGDSLIAAARNIVAQHLN